VQEQRLLPGTLTLGTDNSSAFTTRSTRLAISALGLTHRRGGYRDPQLQAFIESWFRYLKERCVWRNEFETLDQAREVIAAYIDPYHDRPTADSTTKRHARYAPRGTMQEDNYKNSRPEASTREGSGPLKRS
jgi:transposase InsO family protein